MFGVREDELRAIRGNDIAMIFQDPLSALHPLYKVGAQLAETVRAHNEVSKSKARERAIELLGLVGIPDPARRVDSYPHEFSGGYSSTRRPGSGIPTRPSSSIARSRAVALDTS